MCDQVELRRLLATMTLPEKRRDDLRWLGRNLGMANPDHLNLQAALLCIKMLLLDALVIGLQR